jgi:hypothetical protein
MAKFSTRIVNDEDEDRAVRRKMRGGNPRHVTKGKKEDKHADSKHWKRRKDVAIRRFRDTKLSNDGRCEEDDLCPDHDFQCEAFNNDLHNGRVSYPFMVYYHCPSTYQLVPRNGTMVAIKNPPEIRVLLRGTNYLGINGDDRVIIHERYTYDMMTRKCALQRDRCMYNRRVYTTELFDLARQYHNRPGHYVSTYNY